MFCDSGKRLTPVRLCQAVRPRQFIADTQFLGFEVERQYVSQQVLRHMPGHVYGMVDGASSNVAFTNLNARNNIVKGPPILCWWRVAGVDW